MPTKYKIESKFKFVVRVLAGFGELIELRQWQNFRRGLCSSRDGSCLHKEKRGCQYKCVVGCILNALIFILAARR